MKQLLNPNVSFEGLGISTSSYDYDFYVHMTQNMMHDSKSKSIFTIDVDPLATWLQKELLAGPFTLI